MAKDEVIELEGKVVEVMPNAIFKVEIISECPMKGHYINAHLSGKLRMNYIWVLLGDKVKVEVSIYDLTKGRITWRSK